MSSWRQPPLTLALSPRGGPLDPQVVAAGLRVADVEVVHVVAGEQAPDRVVDVGAVGDPLLGPLQAPARVGDDGQVVRAQVRGKAAVLRVTVALGLVDEDRAGQRKRLDAVERIEREEQAPVHADAKVAEAEAAWTVARRDLGVDRVSVARRRARAPHLFREPVADRQDPVCRHAFASSLCRENTSAPSKVAIRVR